MTAPRPMGVSPVGWLGHSLRIASGLAFRSSNRVEFSMAMEAILDFSQPFNPTLLDEIVAAFYNVRDPQAIV